MISHPLPFPLSAVQGAEIPSRVMQLNDSDDMQRIFKLYTHTCYTAGLDNANVFDPSARQSCGGGLPV